MTKSAIKDFKSSSNQAIRAKEDVVKWVKQFQTDRKKIVKIFRSNGRTFFSEMAAVGGSVPQGTVLG